MYFAVFSDGGPGCSFSGGCCSRGGHPPDGAPTLHCCYPLACPASSAAAAAFSSTASSAEPDQYLASLLRISASSVHADSRRAIRRPNAVGSRPFRSDDGTRIHFRFNDAIVSHDVIVVVAFARRLTARISIVQRPFHIPAGRLRASFVRRCPPTLSRRRSILVSQISIVVHLAEIVRETREVRPIQR